MQFNKSFNINSVSLNFHSIQHKPCKHAQNQYMNNFCFNVSKLYFSRTSPELTSGNPSYNLVDSPEPDWKFYWSTVLLWQFKQRLKASVKFQIYVVIKKTFSRHSLLNVAREFFISQPCVPLNQRRPSIISSAPT